MATVRNGQRGAASVLAVAAVCAGMNAPPAGAAVPADRALAVQQSRSALAFRVGGEPQSVSICGRRRTARVVDLGTRALGRAKAYRRRGLPRRPRVLTLRVRRCGPTRGGARVLVKRRLGRGRGSLRASLPTGAVADLQVVAELRRGRVRSRRVAYVRVRDSVVDVPVSFTVSNVNRSRLACPSDGKQYTIAGRLVAPRALPGGASPAATLHLHEFGWGRFFWQFPHPSHDYAREQARSGHASVVIDRLGYDGSQHPPGVETCLGAQADIAHQIVQQLRSGSYASPGSSPVRFTRIALAGHSGGGAIAELEAYSFGGIDGLILFAYADQGFTARSLQEANEQGLACALGGEPAEPGQPGGYAYFAQTAEEWKSFMFTTTPGPVADAAAALRNRDPCGDTASFTPAVSLNNVGVPEIKAPVLLLYGTADAIYEQPAAGEQQRKLFAASADATLRFIPGAGHALTLERQAPGVSRMVGDWLRRRGF